MGSPTKASSHVTHVYFSPHQFKKQGTMKAALGLTMLILLAGMCSSQPINAEIQCIACGNDENSCPPGYFRSPITGRCKKLSVLCPPGQTFNRILRRCVNDF